MKIANYMLDQRLGVDHFIKLTVLKSEITENTIGSELKPHKVGSPLTKKKDTILKGEPQRLHWSEEDVRLSSLKQKD